MKALYTTILFTSLEEASPQLVKNKSSINLACPLFMVGDDAAYKVGVGIPECHHELGELLLVQLTNSSEHSLPGACSKVTVTHCLLCHPHNLS